MPTLAQPRLFPWAHYIALIVSLHIIPTIQISVILFMLSIVNLRCVIFLAFFVVSLYVVFFPSYLFQLNNNIRQASDIH